MSENLAYSGVPALIFISLKAPAKPRLTTKPRKPFYRSKWLWIPLTVVLTLLIIIYFGISIYGAYTFTKNPNRNTTFTQTPASYNLAYQDVAFPSAAPDKLTLRGWWVERPGATRALVMVHGWNMDRTELLVQSRTWWENGYSMLVFDLRGHGASDSEHYFFGQMESWDVVGAFNFVKSKGFNPDQIGINARSMGAASSLLAMGHSSEIRVVFSDSSWADFRTTLERKFSSEAKLPEFFMPGILLAGQVFLGFNIDETRPVAVLPELAGKRIYLMQGDQDNFVPPGDIFRLKEAGGSNIVGTWVVPGSKHAMGAIEHPQEYYRRAVDFFANELR